MKMKFKRIYGVFRAYMHFIMHPVRIKHKGFSFFMEKGSDIRIEEKGLIELENKIFFSQGDIIGAYKNGKLKIGYNNFFNTNVSIVCYDSITIGDNNLFAQNIVIVDHKHNYEMLEKPICKQGFKTAPVVIGSNCWFCSNVVICQGVTIGDHVVVSANSVVSRDMLTPGLYAGSPARLVKEFI